LSRQRMRGKGGDERKRGSGEVGLRGAFRRALSAVRRIAGMPDYSAHVEHLRRHHPDRPVPTERQFYDEFTRARYSDGPTRCC
jgi:uncharacterized short protein YbdD (DUF466 family)